MKKLLLILLLLPLLLSGQNDKKKAFYQQLVSSGAAYEFTYTDIPDAPSTGTSATITYSAPGNILNTTGGDTQNKYLSGAFTEFHAFSFVGTAGTYRRIINLNGSTFGVLYPIPRACNVSSVRRPWPVKSVGV